MRSETFIHIISSVALFILWTVSCWIYQYGLGAKAFLMNMLAWTVLVIGAEIYANGRMSK